MENIVIVCTGNICRSPVGEAAFASYLPDRFHISSAGTHALVGRHATPEAVQFVQRENGVALNHTAQQLTSKLVEDADMIVAMTLEHRAWIAREAPRAVRRAFTLKELDALLRSLSPSQGFASLRELALAASRLRPRLAAVDVELDIADPYGGPPEGYETSFSEVLHYSRRATSTIRRCL